MKSEKRSLAEIPSQHRKDGVRWLVLEDDPASGGWFLFGHRSLREASEFDSWHLTRDEAVAEAQTQWGVRLVDWNDADEQG